MTIADKRIFVRAIGLRAGARRYGAALALLDAEEGAWEEEGVGALSPAEAALLPPHRYGRRRHALLGGRMAAKQALALLVPETDRREISVLPGSLGQPVVQGPRANLGVTLSHAGSTAIAVAFPEDCPIGIDIEGVTAENELALIRHASGAEVARLGHVVADSPLSALTALWCVKEALSKLLRCGLAVSPGLFETDGVDNAGGRLRFGFLHFPGFEGFVVLGGGRCFALALPRAVEVESAEPDILAARSPWLRAGAGPGADTMAAR